MCEAEIGSLSSSKGLSIVAKIHAVVQLGEVFDRCCRRCCCTDVFATGIMRGRVGERDSNLGFPAALRSSPQWFLPVLVRPFHRCFLPLLFSLFSCDSGKVFARSRSSSVPTIAPNENEEEEEEVDNEIITNVGGAAAPKALPLPNRVCESPLSSLCQWD